MVSEQLDTNGREVAPVSDYEIIMIMLGILALPFTACSFLLALLNFLDKRNSKRKYKCLSCLPTGEAVVLIENITSYFLRSIHFGVGAFFIYNITSNPLLINATLA